MTDRPHKSVRRCAARLLLFWPSVILLRLGVCLLALARKPIGRVMLRPVLRGFCRFVLYARALPLLRESVQNVLPAAELASLIGAQKLIAVTRCACRAGRSTCRRPAHKAHASDTCLSFGTAALLQIGSGLGRRVSTDEALALCERAADSGLVHHALYSLGMLAEACNCGPETCTAIRAFSSGIREAVRPSRFRAARGPECDGCAERSSRLCEDICPYGAAPSSPGCLGCALCARHCPGRAIRMEERAETRSRGARQQSAEPPQTGACGINYHRGTEKAEQRQQEGPPKRT